jgi:hypothetical protein
MEALEKGNNLPSRCCPKIRKAFQSATAEALDRAWLDKRLVSGIDLFCDVDFFVIQSTGDIGALLS